MKYCTIVVSGVENEVQRYSDHHLYHQCQDSYHKYFLMLLLSPFESGMPPQALELHR